MQMVYNEEKMWISSDQKLCIYVQSGKTQSIKVHSVSIYFSAVRKIEKVKQRTFILLKCHVSCSQIYSTC